MAKKPAKSGATSPIDPEAIYTCTMARSVKHGAGWLRPNMKRVRLKGTVVLALGDAVASYELLA